MSRPKHADETWNALDLGKLRTHVEDVLGTLERTRWRISQQLEKSSWNEDVLDDYDVLSIQLKTFWKQSSPLLGLYSVFPKTVHSEIAAVLPIMLATKELPEMENEYKQIKEERMESTKRKRTPSSEPGASKSVRTILEEAKEERRTSVDDNVRQEGSGVVTDAKEASVQRPSANKENAVHRSSLDSSQAQDMPPEKSKLLRAMLFGEGLTGSKIKAT